MSDGFRIDEILYHARVHPEQRCNTLSNEQIKEIYEKTIYVPRTAVDVNADDSLFPDNWLFKHRWGKGKKKGNSDVPLLLVRMSLPARSLTNTLHPNSRQGKLPR
jgi:formamidopyrimidine-DNA glycosylase